MTGVEVASKATTHPERPSSNSLIGGSVTDQPMASSTTVTKTGTAAMETGGCAHALRGNMAESSVE